MATSNKLLGQVMVSSTSQTAYTTPAATNAVVSAVVVAEQTGIAATFTLAIVSGASTTAITPSANFLVGGPTTGQSIGASATVVYTLGITMGPLEWLIVRQPSGTGALACNVFGTEIT